MSMTQEEVESLISRDKASVNITRRLARHEPSKVPAKKGEKLAPVAVKRSEMASLRKTGVIPRKMRERIERSGPPVPAEVEAGGYGKKERPTQRPEGGGTRHGKL